MIIRKLIYFILTVISVIFYILFVEKLSFYLMVFIIALPVFLAIILTVGKFSIKCSLNSKFKTAVKNNNCQFLLTIHNKSIFPFPMSVIKIEYSNKLSGITNNIYISVPIHPRTSQTISFVLSSDYCGIMNVKIASVKIFDYIKMFSCKAKVLTDTDVYIIPEISPEILNRDLKAIFTDESEKFSKIKSGDDPSEIFELKDYVPGDKISRIHWNLSSRQNQLITKRYSQCISSPIAVVPDFDFQSSLAEIDSALEFFYGISFLLFENEIIHKIYMPMSFEEVIVSDYNILNECYINILKNNQSDAIEEDNIQSIFDKQSEIYIVTNKNIENYHISDHSLNVEINYVFISDSFEKADFMNSDNIKISKLPVHTALDHLEKILL